MRAMVDVLLAVFGAAMIASFWWVTGIAAALAVALFVARRSGPETRHALAAIGLLAVPVAFVCGFEFPVARAGGEVVAVLRKSGWERSAAMAWLCGVLLLSVRTLGGWFYLRRLLRKATPFTWPGFEALCRRAGLGSNVVLRTTGRCDSPFTAGWLRPVIVIPVAMAAGMSAAQLEAILLHELAHIRRGDYLAEWVLRLMETLFFYHPAVWWMAAVIRKEREMCCDDMAIAAGADRGAYARALVELEEMRVPLLANGGRGQGTAQRVKRILGQTAAPSPWPALLTAGCALVAFLTPAAVAQPSGPYLKWLNEDVTYIIQPEERKRFESLRTNEEVEQFIVQFWQRRDPTPGTMENEAKEEHYRRIRYANDRWRGEGPGWKTKKGKTYIVHGPPDEVEAHPRDNFEQWLYKNLPGVGENVIILFGTRPVKP